MNEIMENKSLNVNLTEDKGTNKKIGNLLSIKTTKKIIKATSVGIAGLTALNLTVSKSMGVEKVIITALDKIIYGHSNIYFLGTFPIPNVVVLVLIICAVGSAVFVATEGLGALLGSKKN